MTVVFSDLLAQAATAQAALGAFTCYDLETAEAVLAGAGSCRAPVVLLISGRSVSSPRGVALLSGASQMAEAARTAACVQLDHLGSVSDDQADEWDCVRAIMVDGSGLDLASNISLTRAAVDLFTARGGEVEGELGQLQGNEDISSAEGSSSFTAPDQAVEFIASTGVTCLAVSVGNRHGPYPRPPDIKWALLKEISRRVPVPLALHGASGLSPVDLGRAIHLGVRKVNFNADLRTAYFSALSANLGRTQGSLDLLTLKINIVQAVQKVVEEKLVLLGWSQA